MIKFYQGLSTNGGGQVIWVNVVTGDVNDDENLELKRHRLHHHVRHSPDGFQWGYGGSGPSEAARCILIDYFGGDKKKADRYYQDFKWKFIAPAKKRLYILDKHIADWLNEIKKRKQMKNKNRVEISKGIQ